MTPSITLTGMMNQPILVLIKCYQKLQVWWESYERKTVNVAAVIDDADQSLIMTVES